MRCFRLTREAYADLAGTGGLLETGRWHAAGAPIIYTSSSRALALLEVLVHLELTVGQIPDDYVYQVIDLPDNFTRLTRDDIEKPDGKAADTPQYGSAWLDQRTALALSAPSIIVPQEANIMLNPLHPAIGDASTQIEHDVIWDSRLFNRPA